MHEAEKKHEVATSLVDMWLIFTGAVNLAVNKPADQTNTWNDTYNASKAVNGITDDTEDYTYTLTKTGTKWWKVNLEAKYSIGRIELYKRKNSGSSMY